MSELWESAPQSLMLQEKNIQSQLRRKKGSRPIFQASSDTTESTRQEAEKTINVDTPGKSKTIDEFMVNTHSKNAEILWCMKVVKSHYSYNSCPDITKILTKMCPDSDIATKISPGKAK